VDALAAARVVEVTRDPALVVPVTCDVDEALGETVVVEPALTVAVCLPLLHAVMISANPTTVRLANRKRVDRVDIKSPPSYRC
jgi:hypothetical protein